MAAPSSKSSLKKLKDRFKQLKEPKGKPASYHSRRITSLDWNCDGTLLASGSDDQDAACFHLRGTSLKMHQALKGHTGKVERLRFHGSEPNVLATVSADCSLRLWDVRTAKQTSEVKTDSGNINVAWHPSGHIVGVGNTNDNIYFYDIRTWKQIAKKSHGYEVNQFTWDQTGDYFFLTTGKNEIPPLHAHTANCVCVTFDRTFKYLASGGADALVSIFDADELICTHTVSSMENPIRSLSFSHDGALFTAASKDETFKIIHVESEQVVHEIETAGTTTACWHPMAYILAYATGDSKSAYVLNVAKSS